jgi:hypothetical protein
MKKIIFALYVNKFEPAVEPEFLSASSNFPEGSPDRMTWLKVKRC